MAEQLLHDAHIGPALQEVGGKRVPQHVRRHPRGDPGALGGVLQHLPCALPRQLSAAGVEEDRRRSAAPTSQLRAAAHQIGVQRLHGRTSDRDQPLLAALATQQYRPGLGIDVVDIEADGFGDA